MKQRPYSTGIDISSKSFVVSISAQPGIVLQGPRKFENNETGFQELHAWFQHHKIKPEEMIICMESTGVYGEHLCYFLDQLRYTVAVEHPLKVKRAFLVDGPKTDSIDSLQIAEYAIRFFDELTIWKPREKIVEKMKALLTTRELLVGQKTAIANSIAALKRKAIQPIVAIGIMESQLKTLQHHIRILEKEMENLVHNNPRMKQTVHNLKSLPGVQNLLAFNMLVITNGFQSERHYKQLCNYLKIAPLQHESGSSIYKKPRAPQYGPSMMRKLLHLAARSVVTHKPQFRQYYLRKQNEGKAKKLILNNVENKLVKLMCAIIRDQKAYVENYRSVHPELLKIA
ncbi:MAG: IS110 family transposase [FCB group bacterium]|nr:IS110 family transposase [FCB group bacterium]